MFWTGLIIGLFIGANVGLFVFALLAAKKEKVSCVAEIETNGNVRIFQQCEEVRT
jgi:Na+/H+ antiporter NhaA